MELLPLVIMAIGVAVVLILILGLRLNAFIALIIAALVVSVLAPGEMATKISRAVTAFGGVAGSIGIVIALASIIGKALLDSGAAERIVRSLTNALGVKQAPAALMASGFVLAVPVFFDTVFYLMVPIARTLWKQVRKNYILFLGAIIAGAAVTHSIVPPTPGPLFMANALGIDLGLMLMVGFVLAVPMSVVGLLVCYIIDRRMPIEMRPYPGEELVDIPEPDRVLPPLWLALAPVLLPVILISAHTISVALAGPADEMTAEWTRITEITGLIGNPSLALLFSTIIAMSLVVIYRKRSLSELGNDTETALMSGGLIILITAAGGAFGAMLREAGIQEPIQALVGEGGSGAIILLSAFAVSSMLKFAQGSGTVAMITTVSMYAAMGLTAVQLGCHPVYLAMAIGSGSLVGDWMNNSGFWIFSKMGGLTTGETLKSWSVLLAAIGFTGLIATLIMSTLLPLV